MIDNSNDIFGLSLERNDTKPDDLPLGLTVPGKVDADELLTIETTMRTAEGYPTKGAVLFLGENDEFENAAEFQRLMNWPRLPTYDEGLAFSIHDDAAVQAKVYYAVEDFRAEQAQPAARAPGKS